jgi:hypothetical protein
LPVSFPSGQALCLLIDLWRGDIIMAEEKKVTETTKTKNDVFGNPKEQKTTTTEQRTKENAFGDQKQTTTTTERKEKR